MNILNMHIYEVKVEGREQKLVPGQLECEVEVNGCGSPCASPVGLVARLDQVDLEVL